MQHWMRSAAPASKNRRTLCAEFGLSFARLISMTRHLPRVSMRTTRRGHGNIRTDKSCGAEHHASSRQWRYVPGIATSKRSRLTYLTTPQGLPGASDSDPLRSQAVAWLLFKCFPNAQFRDPCTYSRRNVLSLTFSQPSFARSVIPVCIHLLHSGLFSLQGPSFLNRFGTSCVIVSVLLINSLTQLVVTVANDMGSPKALYPSIHH